MSAVHQVSVLILRPRRGLEHPRHFRAARSAPSDRRVAPFSIRAAIGGGFSPSFAWSRVGLMIFDKRYFIDIYR
jgi:hypothetical protein